MNSDIDIAALRRLMTEATGVKNIARKTGLSYSWLMQFRHGKIINPTIRSLRVLGNHFERERQTSE